MFARAVRPKFDYSLALSRGAQKSRGIRGFFGAKLPAG
jgi:hypothetical protein